MSKSRVAKLSLAEALSQGYASRPSIAPHFSAIAASGELSFRRPSKSTAASTIIKLRLFITLHNLIYQHLSNWLPDKIN